MPVIYVRDPESGQFIPIPTLKGDKGEKGDSGKAATISLGSFSTGEVGSEVVITNTGTSEAAVFNFTIPRGDQGLKGEEGKAATIEVGMVTTGEAGSNATVSNAGTTNAARLNFVIPRGDKGEAGVDGVDGKAATIEVGTVTTGEAGTQAQVVNSGTSSAATFDFTIPRGDQGLKGDKGDDGYTPVKGTDYWTESDKSEMTNYVLNNVAHKYIDYTLESQSWTSGGEDIFLLSFSDPRIPSDCKLELSLDTQNLIQIMNDGVSSMRADNNNGTVEVVCIGGKPSTNLNVQISFIKIVQA